MVVKWGFSTIGCPSLSLKEAEELGRKAGYPLLEVRISGKDFSERELLRQLAADKRCFILGSSFRLISDSDEARENLKACALLAADCGIPYVRVFGRQVSDDNTVDPHELARRNLAFFDRLDLPVQIILETHDYFASTQRITDLFTDLGRSLPLIWDTWHTWNTGKEPLAETWQRLSGMIFDVHVKDGSNGKLTLPGKGDFPIEELFTLLKKNHYSGMVSCEHEKLWHQDLPELQEAFLALDPYKKILDIC